MVNYYALIDPRDNSVRYIGKSANIERRYKTHLAAVKNDIGWVKERGDTWMQFIQLHSSAKKAWLVELGLLGLKPILRPLPNTFTENGWIAFYLDQGEPILNSCPLMGDSEGAGRPPAYKMTFYWLESWHHIRDIE